MAGGRGRGGLVGGVDAEGAESEKENNKGAKS